MSSLTVPDRFPTESSTAIALGVLASGNGSNFEALAQAITADQLQAEIRLLIYNNPDAYVRQRAERLGIPALLLDHRQFASREDLDQAIITAFRNRGVEWIAMAGWMRLVTETLIQAFPERIINIHPSLLPSFKGIRAVEQAIAAKVRISGCTAHLVTLDVDSGPILVQAAVPVLPDDTVDSLQQRIQVEEHKILPLAIALAAARSPLPV
ncbi:phosphoribosylglycinamide formyltransferase [Synechococcus elongatus]|uniref:Phosphoribosylglycinamide formyltransferase n=2 Tax=Synechococcus elongatus TaxID=32046 RepID=Q31PN1_SYNE7|nr:phosphoribosylglycinamide formyltransferase [Synechococcus elongatus]ABB56988.1 phosphoribosylglycinamide formyltransferase [Synechococcus elongatus PCC 7942 = FACHB-805]AJD58488.1 phosphoribosylglycinamide formyltransferase [Synechococcus elongatus UTEX 2973]MBD2587391.1 phosphoribosylglycinamide formyltransferase [Synechococcus elongatus FACHB-242]MBD2688830.1 phosphoribosylglycinamide formyltransferase [Synechococcus elongatus FACHB-1061]MBD2707901.1 phosphoribosylglycinamide formyltrans